MARLLHVIASPNGAASKSTQVAEAFLESYRDRHPDHLVDSVNVWDLNMPAFDATMIAAKFAILRTQEATEEQRETWARAVGLSQSFNSADVYLFSLPMWNFGVPYPLKHYIDVVTLPGQNWSWTRSGGYVPLLRDKRAILVYSSANDYSPDSVGQPAQLEFQKPFMRKWLGFIGVEVVAEIVVAPTLTDPDSLEAVLVRARREASRIALGT